MVFPFMDGLVWSSHLLALQVPRTQQLIHHFGVKEFSFLHSERVFKTIFPLGYM